MFVIGASAAARKAHEHAPEGLLCQPTVIFMNKAGRDKHTAGKAT